MIRPCEAPRCSAPADVMARIVPPVPDGLAPVVYLCLEHAGVYVDALRAQWGAGATVGDA